MIELLNLDVLNNIIDSRILMNSPQNKEDELTAWWDIEDLKREFKKGNQWCIDMLNYPPFKNELTKLKIVYYPKHNREGYSMVAKQMKQWLIENHSIIRESASIFRTS
ncbi:DUF771 domain-containing protein [Staphylococcus epidermidis]|uniref:DUF771 domain-containing protein n=1 Tax=Staphylococcus epidermidis TaxID=1282 RepID=UPI00124EAE79|nr:DUF771 domain-containing protein [Staphylococcus epidermidis]KAB2233197.1 DUF771 domain-containing protein [Staphylococcus epidermidis]